ncbi:MAG: MBOAT family O-acyltransferase, partial [Flavobacteriales bacterium]
NKAIDGLHLILWGLFKKIVIADSCAAYVNEIFSNYETMNSLTLILGAIYFTFQIYCDFSGYSDIAIGTSKLFGFSLIRNFNFPYFSRDISEFWRRWHISLSKYLPTVKEFLQMSFTFGLTVLAWIFFRADSVLIAVKYIKNIFSFNFKRGIQYLSIERYAPELLILILLFIISEWSSREREHPFFGKWRHLKISLTILALVTLGVYSNVTDFIYFQF